MKKLSEQEIFAELPKAFEILPGYEYYVAYMTSFPGCRVYVSSTEPNSVSSWSFARGDAILSVESAPVTAVNETRQRILSALKSKKFVKTIIEKPSTLTAFRLTNYALQYDKQTEIDPKMAEDVIEICKKELVFWRRNQRPTPEMSILKNARLNSQQPQQQQQRQMTITQQQESSSLRYQSNVFMIFVNAETMQRKRIVASNVASVV
ncbi:unnamed protein product [Anisakis simplex]|uniref:PDZ domain-containing protein n=1 Tax=Anisakis simplex TaxID=6269 RepID=A0A3P6NFB2_ANISI|nr:unnamed protein product [Anisakis simplex]